MAIEGLCDIPVEPALTWVAAALCARLDIRAIEALRNLPRCRRVLIELELQDHW